MQPLVHRLRLCGRLTDVRPGLRAASLSGEHGAHLRSELVFLDRHRFREEGTVDFGDGRARACRTIGVGHLGATGDPRRRHGTAARELDGGRGRMTSNFLLAADGTVVDEEVAVLFDEIRED
jgi:hypothetical protein